MNIGVFDSGVGGKSFVIALQHRFPQANITYKTDKQNIPYGTKSADQLYQLTLPFFKEFEKEGCDAVLVACNTLTTNCIEKLRKSVNVPLVGVEPMLKPAALRTKSGIIAVCATPATLASKRYTYLKETYASDVRVVEPDCSNWAYMIEQSRQHELELEKMIASFRRENVDVVVLGCTHYHWIEKELQLLAGEDMAVIQPIEPVLEQVERVTGLVSLPPQ